MEAFVQFLRDRLTVPFYGAFAISWIVFNWDAVIYVWLSKQITHAELVIIRAQYGNLMDNLMLPLAYAVGALIIAQFIQLTIDAFTVIIIVLRKKLQIWPARQDKRLLIERTGIKDLEDALEKNEELKIELEQVRTSGAKFMKQLNTEKSENEKLQTEVKRQATLIDVAKNTNEDLAKQNSSHIDKIKVIKEIANLIKFKGQNEKDRETYLKALYRELKVED